MNEGTLQFRRQAGAPSRAGKVRLSLFAALFALIGCGRPATVDLYAVEGTLLVNGSPAANASVAFHPLERGPEPRYPVGRTDSNGRFQLTTERPADGAPAGDYMVTIVWIDESFAFDECQDENPLHHDRLKGYYADAELTELRATVRRTNNSLTFYTRQPPEYAVPQILSRN